MVEGDAGSLKLAMKVSVQVVALQFKSCSQKLLKTGESPVRVDEIPRVRTRQ